MFRSNGQDKDWQKNVYSHPLEDISHKIDNLTPSKKHGEMVECVSQNTESFEVLVTCSTAESSKSPDVSHKLLKQKDDGIESGRLMKHLNYILC